MVQKILFKFRFNFLYGEDAIISYVTQKPLQFTPNLKQGAQINGAEAPNKIISAPNALAAFTKAIPDGQDRDGNDLFKYEYTHDLDNWREVTVNVNGQDTPYIDITNVGEFVEVIYKSVARDWTHMTQNICGVKFIL